MSICKPHRVALLAIAWAGCHAAVRDPPASHSPAAGASVTRSSAKDAASQEAAAAQARREQLVARAEQSLAHSWPLDYQRPFSDRSSKRPTTAGLYLEACHAGDKRSCWVAATLDDWKESPALLQVTENCRRGDHLSCRALPIGVLWVDHLPGASGRTARCQEADGASEPCQVERLREECLAGFPLSCRAAGAQSARDLPDRESLAARTIALAREGCAAGVEHECAWILNELPTNERKAVLERLCPLSAGACSGLSSISLDAGEIERARELAERVCQYAGTGNTYGCDRLSEKYLDGTYPEPVPGRGEALIAWVCEQPGLKDHIYPCKARTKRLEQEAKAKAKANAKTKARR